MIESGSHVPGVRAADFALPPNTALRYELPDARLRPYISDYHVLDSVEASHDGTLEWMLPAWPAIRFVLADRRMSLTIGNRAYDPHPVAALYGTTTRAIRVNAHGGVTIGANIGPLGWSRLFRAPASSFRDRVVPLDEMMPPGAVAEVIEALRASDRGPAAKAILDPFFLDMLGPRSRDEPLIAALADLIGDADTNDLPTAAAASGISPAALRRLSTRYFGFPPKTLLNRARFMRAFLKMKMGGLSEEQVIAGQYYDSPHFLRDSYRFLGMTPRRFMALDTPYLDAALRARRLVLRAARDE